MRSRSVRGQPAMPVRGYYNFVAGDARLPVERAARKLDDADVRLDPLNRESILGMRLARAEKDW